MNIKNESRNEIESLFDNSVKALLEKRIKKKITAKACENITFLIFKALNEINLEVDIVFKIKGDDIVKEKPKRKTKPKLKDNTVIDNKHVK